MRTVNVNVLSATDTASHNGAAIDSNQLIWVSFQAVFGDSTAAGTFEIQASNDLYADRYQSYLFTPTNWTTVGTAAVSSGASEMIVINPVTYRWLRVVYISASGGSSTINVNMYAQSI